MVKIINKCLHLERIKDECGDVIDSFPCPHCGAKTPSECPISLDKRVAAANVKRAAKGGAA